MGKLKAILYLLAALSLNARGEAMRVEIPPQGFDAGGWSLDAQFMDVMGSPYLLAHGLGVPVEDATATVAVPVTGRYRVWARTRNWAPGSPGRFRIAVNGRFLDKVFGAGRDVWDWEDGGTVELDAGRVTVALRDLTGFDGRCAGVVLAADAQGRVPPVKSSWTKRNLTFHFETVSRPDGAGCDVDYRFTDDEAYTLRKGKKNNED
jgi:hypothetical protein